MKADLKALAPDYEVPPPSMPVADGVTLFGFAAAQSQSISRPLTAIAAEIETLRALIPEDDGKVRAAIERIASVTRRACDEVVGAQALLRATACRTVSLDVNAAIRDVALRLASARSTGKLDIRLDLDPGLPVVDANRAQIEKLLWETMINAAEAMARRPDLEAILEVRSFTTVDAVQVEIVDRAGGVEDPERIFEIFFTTKQGHPGVGLGIARSLAVINGGQLWAERHEPDGTRLILSLPLEDRA